MGQGVRVGRTGCGHVATIALLLILILGKADGATAAPPEFFGQIPETQAVPGAGAGELDNPRSLAADPATGHVYIADRRNARVSEYTAWGLFVKAWGWGVADGSTEPQTCGPAEPASDPPPALCQAGLPGAGKGQMALLSGGMAVDAAGNVWVGDLDNLRVQKFGPSGQFLLMFGGDVNKTKVEEGAPAAQRNVCPVDPGDVCQAGISGEGPSQLSGSTIGDYVAYSPSEGGTILVGDKGSIQVFDPSGNHVKTILFEGQLVAFAGRSVNALDVDKGGNIYFSLSGTENVFKLDSTGVPLVPGKPAESSFEVGVPLGVAVDVAGNVYAIDDPPLDEARILKFDSSGSKVVPTQGEEEEEKFFPYVPFQGPALTGLATGFCTNSDEPGNLYSAFFDFGQVSYVDAYGTPPIGCEDPPEREPEVLEQFAVSVGREEAVVKAQINPLFWPDTTYYVEYGTGKCSAGGCPNQAPVSPGLLIDKSINAPVTTAGVVLEDLLPDITYHYRFVADSGGGGPVFGIDPDGREGSAKPTEAEGLEAGFRTFRPLKGDGACANDAVRTGESAKLPDCRAYEMVSPLDKGGADAAPWIARNNQLPHLAELDQSSSSGDRFAYTSAAAFGEAQSAPFASQYVGARDPLAGWTSEAVSPPRTESPVGAESLLTNEFHGFSEDLCTGWIRHYSVAPLAAGAVEGYPNVYRLENCASPPSYEALTTVKPPQRPATKFFEVRVLGFSADGAHTVFTANDKLHPDAPTLGELERSLYESAPGGLRFVCYLPDGSQTAKGCSAGTAAGNGGGYASSVKNAVSSDGSRIFWSAHDPGGGGIEPSVPGQIYVRIDGAETRKVSTAVGSDPAWYWTASDDGSKAIFEFANGPHEGELYELDVDTETPTLIAGEVEGPMGASEDASRIYFASKEDLDDAGPATAGDHNLYLYDADLGGGGGDFTFVMELTERDIGGSDTRHAAIDPVPAQRAARVSPDGLHAAFVSSVSPTPTGYDNLDADSGEPAQEVYLYDAVEDELRCVSCNPSGARPVGEDLGEAFPLYAAARIQGWEALNHAPRVLSGDGTRVFFESFEALVPRDTNSTWDVYQWEEEGKGTCEASSETFVEESGGCVDLISSGLSERVSTFLDADPSGDNVFFGTLSSLVGQDYGLNDVYVARVGGGFPEPIEEDECEGEACQSPPPPPPEVTPSTELSAGPGNEPATKQRKARRCPKGKRRVKRAGKVRCVKRKARAGKTARAAR